MYEKYGYQRSIEKLQTVDKIKNIILLKAFLTHKIAAKNCNVDFYNLNVT